MTSIDRNHPVAALHAPFEALARLCQRRAAAVGMPIAEPPLVLPEPDGAVSFRFGSGPDAPLLHWVTPPRGGELVRAADLLRDVSPEAVDPRLRDAAAAALQTCLADPRLVLLKLFNRSRDQLVFDTSVVDALVAGRLALGTSHWYGWRLTSVNQQALVRLSFTFEDPAGVRLIVGVSPSTHRPLGSAVFATIPPLYLELLDDQRDAATRNDPRCQPERILSFLLARAVHPELEVCLAAEPRTTAPGAHTGPDAAGNDRLPLTVSMADFAHPHQWRRFFADFEMERSTHGLLQITDPAAFVTHGEYECQFIEPADPSVKGFIVQPWPKPDLTASRGFSTQLTEADVIGGGSAGKLEQALADANADPTMKFIFLNDTCVTKVLGDDIGAIKRAHAQRGGAPLIHMNALLESPGATFLDLFDQLSALRDNDHWQAPDEPRINLVGFVPDPGLEELLTDLRRESDIVINARLVPQLSLEATRCFGDARIQALYPLAAWEPLYQRVFRRLPVPAVVMPAPYGLAGTLAFIRSIGEAMGRLEMYRDRYADADVLFQSAWRRLRDRAQGRRVAFIMEPHRLAWLRDPPRFHGVPVVPVLAEMGIGLDVLWYADPDPAAATGREAALKEIASLVAYARTFDADLAAHAFSSQEELHALLRDGPCTAAYSEIRADDRIIAAGRTPFGPDVFERGFNGAFRTFQRFLTITSTPFFRRYAAYLAPTGEPDASGGGPRP